MKRRQSWGVAIGLFILAFIPHWRTALLGEVPLPEGYLALLAPTLKPQLRPTAWNALWWDGIGQFWAWRTEAMRQIAEGHLPLWTNRIGCGFPFLANPQTAVLYPPNFIAQWWGASRQYLAPDIAPRASRLMAWLAFFHTLLALVGAYLLIRSYGITRLSSLVGAAAFGLGSFQTAWALLPTLPATAAWLPLTLWLVRRCAAGVPKGEGYWGAWLALALAMLLLAGHGQIALYAFLAIALFVVMELVVTPHRWRIAIAFLFSGMTAVLMAAAQLLPTTELTPLTHRAAPPSWDGYRAFAQRGLTLLDWATMTLPFLFGNPMDGSYFGKESFADYCAYAGFGVLTFALLGIGHWALARNLKLKAPSHALALFILGALLASGSTFNFPLYFLLPGFAQLGTPTRAVFLCQLALGMLAAFGLDEIWKAEGGRKKLIASLFALALPLAGTMLTALFLQRQFSGTPLQPHLTLTSVIARNSGVIAGAAAVLLSLLSVNHSPISLRQSLFRYSITVLLFAELSWFAAQQIPTARPDMVRQALQIAKATLRSLIPHSPSIIPRLLPLGVNWSLTEMPKTSFPPNSLLLLSDGFADARNYDSLLLRHHKAVMAIFSDGNPCPVENGNLILLPMAKISLDKADRLAGLVGAEGVLMQSGEGLSLFLGRPDAPTPPRAFVPLKVQFVTTVNEAFAQIPTLLPDEAVIVAKQERLMERPTKVRIIQDKDSLVRLESQPKELFDAAMPVWLLLSDTAYPGWRAFLHEGYGRWRLLPTAIANFAFRACRLPNAGGKVVWVYFPSSFSIGMFLSCVGVSVTAAWFIVAFRRQR